MRGGEVSLAGINDLETYRATSPDRCGGPQTIDDLVSVSVRAGRDVYADTSPARLARPTAKVAVISGALDPIVPRSFGPPFSAHWSAEELTIEGAGHFELIDPTSTAWTTVIAPKIDQLAR